MSLLILGIGNVLMGDEGVGVHLLQALRTRADELPAGTELVDGGTLGIELLPLVADAAALLLLDAVALHEHPAAVRLLDLEQIEAVFGGHVSPHQAGAGDLVAVARLTGSLPERAFLLGIEPQILDVGTELSAAVAAALPVAANLAIETACRLVGEPEASHA